MAGFIGMDMRSFLHLLFNGLVCGCQHATDSALSLADGSPAKTQSEVLFELALYLADGLMILAALQSTAHLGMADRL